MNRKLIRVLTLIVLDIWCSGCSRSSKPITAPSVVPSTSTPGPSEERSLRSLNSTVVAVTSAIPGFHPSSSLFVNGPTNVKIVALTFDAGADDTAVPLLLQTLAEHHVRCTFFLTGAFCRKFPKQCRAIADAGMEIGNHSFHHPHFTKRTNSQIEQEITTAEEEIVKVCGRGAKPLFRYPYGDSDRRVRAEVASLGYQAVHWTLDSLDSVGKPKDANYVAARILSRIKPGSITLMHVSRVESAKSLPRIFDYLDKQGIQVAPVSQLLANAMQQPKHKAIPHQPKKTS